MNYLISPAALEFCLHNVGQEVNMKEFDDACGVGVIVSPEEIETAVCTSSA